MAFTVTDDHALQEQRLERDAGMAKEDPDEIMIGDGG